MPSLPMASVALKIAIVIEAYLGPNKRLKYFNPVNANLSKMVKHSNNSLVTAYKLSAFDHFLGLALSSWLRSKEPSYARKIEKL